MNRKINYWHLQIGCGNIANEVGNQRFSFQNNELWIPAIGGPDLDESVRQILALKIDPGSFGRVISFPKEIRPKKVQAEQRNGLLWIHLPL